MRGLCRERISKTDEGNHGNNNMHRAWTWTWMIFKEGDKDE